MINFQQTFFDNGTVSNIVLMSANPLSTKVKKRIRAQWGREYGVNSGGKKPIILDGDFTIKTLGAETIKDLDFTPTGMEGL